MRTVARHLRMAWLEYLDARDGAVFTHAASARLGFENAFSLLPEGSSRSCRKASNLVDTEICVRTSKGKKKNFSGLLGLPGMKDRRLLDQWVTSPAVDGDALVANASASHPIDLLVVSGHGSGGDVWGPGAGMSVPGAFSTHEGEKRSGRLKCMIVATCNNLVEEMAPLWLPMFNHAEPVYLLLGYEKSYTGGALGARIMAQFIDEIAKNRKIRLVDAWRKANEDARLPQPWAALAAEGAEAMSLEDWVAGRLPVLDRVYELVHFNRDHASGRRAKLVDDRFDVSWVMEDGLVIDRTNNLPDNASVGLFDGKSVKIRIAAKQRDLAFHKGQEVYLSIYRYRNDKEFDIRDLLEFDRRLLAPHPATGRPVVNPEKARLRSHDGVDALRLVIPAETSRLELDATVKTSASHQFLKDGPGGTFGRFLLHFIPEYDLGIDDGRETVVRREHSDSYAATAGALLRR